MKKLNKNFIRDDLCKTRSPEQYDDFKTEEKTREMNGYIKVYQGNFVVFDDMLDYNQKINWSNISKWDTWRVRCLLFIPMPFCFTKKNKEEQKLPNTYFLAGPQGCGERLRKNRKFWYESWWD